MKFWQRTLISLVVLSAWALLQAEAQDFTLHIAGNTPNNVSGISRPYFDYWIKPKPNANAATIRIFDAALSPKSNDVIYGRPDMRTTYTLYRFTDLYALEGKKLLAQPNPAATPLATLSVLDEERYRNRWELLSQVPPDSMGYIVRASISGGNDVNAFKLVATETSDPVQQSPQWELIAIDLSIGTINLGLSQEVQLKPYFEDEPPPPLSLVGEEGAQVVLKDDFGNSARLSESAAFWQPVISGEQNHWGLSISRSGSYNFFTVVGTQEPVLWNLQVNVAKIQSPPRVRILQTPGNQCDEVRFSVSDRTLARRFARDFTWLAKLPDGIRRATGDSAQLAFGQPGLYNAELWIPTEGIYFPKRWVVPFSVRINAPPVAKIAADKRILAPNETTMLSAENSFDPDGNILRYEWFVGSALRSKDTRFRFSSLSPGRYPIVLRVIDDASNSPCVSSTDTLVLIVNSQPYAEIDYPKEFAVEETVTFAVQNAQDSDGDSLRYEWRGLGVASDPTQERVEVQHTQHGTYSITLRVSDFAGVANSSYQTSVSYRVNAPPVPRFSLPELAAPGDRLRLSAAASSDADDRTLSYSWLTSDGQSFEGRDIVVQFAEPGDYTVTLTVDDGHGVSNSIQSLSRNIHINFPPIPKIDAAEKSTVARQTFSARNTTDGDDSTLRYRWDFGDGTTAEGVEVTHTFQKSGRYTITLTVDDGRGQTNSVQKTTHTFRLFRYPTAQFEAPSVAEPNKPIFLDARKSVAPEGQIASFKWFVNDKLVAEGDTATIVISESGDHDIRLVVQDDSGFEDAKSIQTKKIHLNYAPVPQYRLSTPVAAPNQTIVFDATPSFDKDGRIKQVRWQFADGSVANGAIVRKSFAKTGIQRFTLTVDDGQGFENSQQSIQGEVLINSAPIIVTETVIRSNARRILLDASKSYDIDKHALSFEWIFPDGSKQTAATLFWDAPRDGVHFITLTADDGQNLANSKTRETIKVLINRPPVAVVDSAVEACTGQTILFNGSRCYDPDGDALKFFWDFGDGTTSTQTDPAHTYTKPGQYSVVLKLDDGFVQDPTVAIIPVFIGGSPLAIPSFTDTTVCVQTMLTFDGSRSVNPVGTIGSFAWDFGDGETALGQTVQHSYSKPGVYSVSLTVVGTEGIAKRGKCSNVSQATAVVRVVAGPIAEFRASTWVAVGDEVVLDASPSTSGDRITSYEWQIQGDTLRQGDLETLTKSGVQTSHRFSKPGLYPVTLTITTDSKTLCKTASQTKFVRVNAPPVLRALVPEAVAVGERFVLDASPSFDPDGIITRYEWRADGQPIGTTPKVAHVFSQAGLHQLELRITDDSPTRTNAAVQVFTVFANAAPKPEIVLPSPIYENERIALLPRPAQDADGDSLRFSWQIDGKPYTADSIQFSAGRHILQLVADDQRNLRNSRDSVVKEIEVVPAPPFPTSLPQHLIQGTTLDLSKDFRASAIGFVTSGSAETIVPKFQATELGKTAVRLGWQPRKDILKTETFELTVWEALKFTELPKPLVLVWNPANPTVILSAPPVNRPDERKVIYKWMQGKRVLGYGKTLEVPVRKGENLFVVEASEEGVAGSKAISTTLVVRTE